MRGRRLVKVSGKACILVPEPLVWSRIPAWGADIDWSDYRNYVYNKYGSKYANMQYNYAAKYKEFLENPSRIETLPSTIRQNVLKALICLSKYSGIYLEFRNRLKQYGIKWSTSTSFDSFIRIFNRDHTDLLKWYTKAYNVLNDNEKLYLKYMLLSGLRMSEGVMSVNKIIKFHKEDKLSEYYNQELSVLEHFKFKRFLRTSKNVFVTIIPRDFIMQIAESKPVVYITLRKHLKRHGLKTRIKELRQYWGSFMVRHDLIKEEVDIFQGRVSRSIFVRHYLTISFKELRDRTLKAIRLLEQSL